MASRYAEYADNDYTPGQVYRAGLGEYNPAERIEYRNIKRRPLRGKTDDPMGMGFGEVAPVSDGGEMFQKFLNMVATDGQSLMPQLPAQFGGMY